MFSRLASALLVGLALLSGCATSDAQPLEPARSIELGARSSFAPIVRRVAPAVVSITSRKTTLAREPFFDDPLFQFFFGPGGLGRPRPRIETSLGSGVILRPDGLVVTNHHVVEGAEEIEVVLADRRSFRARVLGSDRGSDLAFLKIDVPGERLPTVPLGDSDAIEVGDVVLAIGNPFGIGQTVTLGIVSAKSRTHPALEKDVSFIQTDAAINPGNSGGALVTADGRLIGINTAIFTRSGGSIGIGFAVPANLVAARLAALEGGRRDLARPWLGAEVQAVDSDIARDLGLDRPRGVLVRRVIPGGPAARAGLRAGDVIENVDGVAVDDPSSLAYRLSLKPLGERVRLVVRRDGQERVIGLPLEPAERRPRNLARLEGRHPLDGLTVGELTPGLAEELELAGVERGVVVLGVDPARLAARFGFRRGDLLESVNGQPVASVDELQAVLRRGARGGWQIGVRRGDQRLVLSVG
ncbi:MAG: Do family serine endopeptidase [Geminicoccaceae bacterium]|nr:Do family serine endopeptidase [Geminicoccaceae bacterium]MCX7629754.1 Do family serine endopeptidase [Geminicoccaceae bacterium]